MTSPACGFMILNTKYNVNEDLIASNIAHLNLNDFVVRHTTTRTACKSFMTVAVQSKYSTNLPRTLYLASKALGKIAFFSKEAGKSTRHPVIAVLQTEVSPTGRSADTHPKQLVIKTATSISSDKLSEASGCVDLYLLDSDGNIIPIIQYGELDITLGVW